MDVDDCLVVPNPDHEHYHSDDMSAPLLKLLYAFAVTLSLVPTVAAVPIPTSSPTAIAFIASLTVVPVLFILLLIVKYFYVKNRKANETRGHTRSNGSSQLRTRHHLGYCFLRSDCKRQEQRSWLACSGLRIGRLKGKGLSMALSKKRAHTFRMPSSSSTGSAGLYFLSGYFLSDVL